MLSNINLVDCSSVCSAMYTFYFTSVPCQIDSAFFMKSNVDCLVLCGLHHVLVLKRALTFQLTLAAKKALTRIFKVSFSVHHQYPMNAFLKAKTAFLV